MMALAWTMIEPALHRSQASCSCRELVRWKNVQTPYPAASLAVMRSNAWIWTAIALLCLCVWVNHRVTARQSDGAGGESQGSKAAIETGDVHALARLEPAAGLIIVGARPGARIEQIEVGAGDTVKPGQVLVILEGHEQARAQLAVAEAQKTRAIHQRSVRKQKLGLEREQFDKVQKAKLESAMRVFSSKHVLMRLPSCTRNSCQPCKGKIVSTWSCVILRRKRKA